MQILVDGEFQLPELGRTELCDISGNMPVAEHNRRGSAARQGRSQLVAERLLTVDKLLVALDDATLDQGRFQRFNNPVRDYFSEVVVLEANVAL